MLRTITIRSLAAAAAFALTALATPTRAFAAEERSFAVNAQVGVLFPGTVTIEDTDVDTKTGLVLRGGLDFFLIPKLSLGVFVLNARTSAEDADVDASVLGLGGTLTGHFGALDRLHARAGLEVSYQIDSIDVAGAKDAKGLGLAVFLEGVFPVSPEANLLARLSFITQPTGGNSDVDVSWGPIFYVSVGAEYSK